MSESLDKSIDETETEQPGTDPVLSSNSGTGGLWHRQTTPRTHHEQMQARIVTTSLAFVGIIISAGAIRWLIDPTIDLTSYTADLLTPVIGLVAAIVGYFFGKGSKSKLK